MALPQHETAGHPYRNDGGAPRRLAARPRIAAGKADEVATPATQSAFYELICIGWLALAAISIWIAILY